MRCGLWLAWILIVAVSCVDNKDYDLKSVDLNPSMGFPLAFGEMSIQDILQGNDSVNVKIDENDLVYLEYSQTLISRDIRDLFSIPDKSTVESFSIPAGLKPAHNTDIRSDSLVEVFDLGLSPEKLSEIDFKSGTIEYSAVLLPNTSNLDFQVYITSSDFHAKQGGLPLSVVANGVGSLPLSDYTLTLNKNKFNLKMVLVLKKSTVARTVSSHTTVQVRFSMLGMNFNVIRGYFGDQTANPPSDLVNIGAFGTSLGKAHVSFAQPAVSLEVVNDYGVPCKVNFTKIEGRKAGSAITLHLNPVNPIGITFPSVLGTSSSTPVAVTNSKQVLDFAPTEFFYQISARINAGVSSGNNFMADTSKLRVKLHVHVPIYGQATGIVLRDTMKLDLGDVDHSEVHEASLKISAVNELPLDANVQLYLTDAQDAITDSLLNSADTELIRGSTVSATGDLQSPGTLDKSIALDEDKLNKIFAAEKMIVVAVLNTSKDSDGNTVDVKFKSKYILKVHVGLKANLNFNIKF